MKFRIYTILSYCYILCSQFDLSNSRAIIGENVRQANEKEFPFIVSLLKVNNEDPNTRINRFCTGSLISNRDILTAAHCLTNKDISSVQIIMGSIDLRLSRTYFPLWWITYNNWAKNKNIILDFQDNDVAVIRLTTSVTDDIKPAVLSTLSSSDLYGLDVAIAGWGRSNNGEIPMIMETVNLKVLEQSECESRALRLEGQVISIHIRILCTASNPYAQLNNGDSGGPLLYKNKLVAINYGTYLFPNITFHPEKINLHFGIDYYRNFILDIINNYK